MAFGENEKLKQESRAYEREPRRRGQMEPTPKTVVARGSRRENSSNYARVKVM